MVFEDFSLQEQEELMRATNFTGADFKAWFDKYDKLIKSVVRKYQNFKSTVFDMEDIIQEGWKILFDRLSGFKPELGSFSNYLYPYLVSGITGYVDGNSAGVTVDPRLNQRKISVKMAEREFRKNHNSDPTPAQLASICGLSVEKVEEALRAYDVSTGVMSLNNSCGDSDSDFFSSIPDGRSVFEEIESASTREEVARAISDVLTQTERIAVKIRFGLFDGESHTEQEVADIMGLNSRQHAHKIIKNALEKLREAVYRSDAA